VFSLISKKWGVVRGVAAAAQKLARNISPADDRLITDGLSVLNPIVVSKVISPPRGSYSSSQKLCRYLPRQEVIIVDTSGSLIINESMPTYMAHHDLGSVVQLGFYVECNFQSKS
jgi:hypothetical protein